MRLPLDEDELRLARAVPAQPQGDGPRELVQAAVVELQRRRVEVDRVDELRILAAALALATLEEDRQVLADGEFHGAQVVVPHPVLGRRPHEGLLVVALGALLVFRFLLRVRRVQAAEPHNDVAVVVPHPAHVVHAPRVEGLDGPLGQDLVVLLQQLAHGRHVDVDVALDLQKRVAARGDAVREGLKIAVVRPRLLLRRAHRLQSPQLRPHLDDLLVRERVAFLQLRVERRQKVLVRDRLQLAHAPPHRREPLLVVLLLLVDDHRLRGRVRRRRHAQT